MKLYNITENIMRDIVGIMIDINAIEHFGTDTYPVYNSLMRKSINAIFSAIYVDVSTLSKDDIDDVSKASMEISKFISDMIEEYDNTSVIDIEFSLKIKKTLVIDSVDIDTIRGMLYSQFDFIRTCILSKMMHNTIVTGKNILSVNDDTLFGLSYNILTSNNPIDRSEEIDRYIVKYTHCNISANKMSISEYTALASKIRIIQKDIQDGIGIFEKLKDSHHYLSNSTFIDLQSLDEMYLKISDLLVASYTIS